MSTQIDTNTVEQCEKSEKKLMNKTKKELIDIIFRKDDVECQLRKEFNAIKLDFEKAKKMYDNSQSQVDALRCAYESVQRDVNNYQDLIDGYVSNDANNKHCISLYKRLTIFFAVTTIVATILIFVL